MVHRSLIADRLIANQIHLNSVNSIIEVIWPIALTDFHMRDIV